MLYFLLVLSLVFGTLRVIFSKKIAEESKEIRQFLFLNFIAFSAMFISALAAFFTNSTSASSFTVIWSLIYSFILMTALFSNMAALKNGHTGICTLLYSSGFVISAFAGIIFWKETFHISQAVGILFILVSFLYVSIGKSNINNNTEGKSSSKMWLLLGFISMAASGILGIIQKKHQTSVYKNELFAFLTIAFAVSCIVSLLAFIIFNKASKIVQPQSKIKANILIFAVANGLSFGIINILNLYLAGRLPSMLFFPIYNGGIILTGIASGIFLFKDKLTKKTFISLLFGFLGIILIAAKPF